MFQCDRDTVTPVSCCTEANLLQATNDGGLANLNCWICRKIFGKKCVFSSVVCCLDLHLNLSLFVCICIICQPSSIGQTHHHQHKTSIFQISKVVKWRKGHPYPSDAICQRTKGSRMLCPRMFQGKVFDLHQVPVLRCCC